MTVVEMMIACAVVVLLGLMTINFLVPAMALSAQGSMRAEMQQQASIAMIKITKDLEATSVGGLGILTPAAGQPNGIGVNTILSASDEAQAWDSKLRCYLYFPGTKKLIYKVYPPGPPDPVAMALPFNPVRPIKVSPADLLQIANQANGSEMTLAGNVEAFTVELTPPGRSAIEVNLKLQQTVPHSQKVETLDFRRFIAVRNGN